MQLVNGIVQEQQAINLGVEVQNDLDNRQRAVFRARRREFEAMPTVPDALEFLTARIAAEDRHDLDLTANDLQMREDNGELLIRGNGSRALSQLALSQLCDRLQGPRYAGAYLSDVPCDRRAREVNAILAQNSGRELKLRMRKGDPDDQLPHIFCVASPKYVAYDPDQLSRDVIQVYEQNPLLADSRCMLEYEGTRTTIQLISHTTKSAETYQVGLDVFRTVYALRIGDDKRTGIHVWAEYHRDRCKNMALIQKNGEKLISGKHFGDVGTLGPRIHDAIYEAGELMTPFLEMWSDRSRNTVYNPERAISVLCGLETDFPARLRLPGVSSESLETRLLAAYNREPVKSQTGLVNAITRAAHESRWPSRRAIGDLQEQARHLLREKPANFNRIIDAEVA